MRPKSNKGWKNRAEIGAAQISTVRFVLDEMMPFGKFRYAAMPASAVPLVVFPGSVMRTPFSVAPLPRTVKFVPEMLSA